MKKIDIEMFMNSLSVWELEQIRSCRTVQQFEDFIIENEIDINDYICA